uniref:Uncharacterized protein n=1 Tax=Anguilla anguilla TaxID=7936 RepID=A0A0E9UNE1_ANGAN
MKITKIHFISRERVKLGFPNPHHCCDSV